MERFLDEVEIDNQNSSSNTTTFIQQTFALQVQNLNLSSLNGQTFNVDLGSVEEARNTTGDIEDSDLVTVDNAMDVLVNATAAIQISEELLEYCTQQEASRRLSYSVFIFDTFFRNQDPNMTVGSLIVSTRLKCGDNTSHPPINVTLRSSIQVWLHLSVRKYVET